MILVCGGIDPGLDTCGWGIVLREKPQIVRHLAHGVVSTSPGDGDNIVRCLAMAQRVSEAVLRHAPAIVCIEHWVPYANVVPVQAYNIGMVTGALLNAFRSISVVSAGSAQQWRIGIGLSRKAPKDAIAKHVMQLLRMKELPRPSHASDALGMATALAFRTIPSRMSVVPCEHGCSTLYCPTCSTEVVK